MTTENENCIVNFGYQLPGENKVSVEVVDMTSGEIIATYNQTQSEFFNLNSKTPTDYKSARFITNNESAKLGQLAAQEVKGASYQILCKKGAFSTSPEYSFQLSQKEVGVELSFKDLLSRIRYDQVLNRLRLKTTQ